jgi:hypothetical protein
VGSNYVTVIMSDTTKPSVPSTESAARCAERAELMLCANDLRIPEMLGPVLRVCPPGAWPPHKLRAPVDRIVSIGAEGRRVLTCVRTYGFWESWLLL